MGLDPNPLGVYERLIVGTNPEQLALDRRDTCRARGNIHPVIAAPLERERMPSEDGRIDGHGKRVRRVTGVSQGAGVPSIGVARRSCSARYYDMRSARFTVFASAGFGRALLCSTARQMPAAEAIGAIGLGMHASGRAPLASSELASLAFGASAGRASHRSLDAGFGGAPSLSVTDCVEVLASVSRLARERR